jgi:thioredoxin 1
VTHGTWRFAPDAASVRRSRMAGAALAVCVLLVLVVGGCAHSRKIKAIADEATFEKEVIQSKQPVLVEFAKGGCPTCAIVEPKLERLSDDYAGRVTVVRFELMRAWFTVTSSKLQKQHRIVYFPTVILFVDGQEKKRWVLDSNIENYRKVLTELVGPPAEKEPSAKPAETPAAAAP